MIPVLMSEDENIYCAIRDILNVRNNIINDRWTPSDRKMKATVDEHTKHRPVLFWKTQQVAVSNTLAVVAHSERRLSRGTSRSRS